MGQFRSPREFLDQTTFVEHEPTERLGRESGRLFVDTVQRGILALTRKKDETAQAFDFIKTVNTAGAEFIVQMFGMTGDIRKKLDVELGRRVYQLQRADYFMFPDMRFIDSPGSGVTQGQLCVLMARHESNMRQYGDLLPSENRVNREDAALEISNIISDVVEANPSGLQLDLRAKRQLENIAVSYDCVFISESET